MSETFLVGSLVPLTFTVENSDGNPAAPGGYTLVVIRPDGTTDNQTANVTTPELGTYQLDYAAGIAGRHIARFNATSINAGVIEDAFTVVAVNTPYGQLPKLKTYLGTAATQWSDEVLMDVLDAEIADQVTRVGERSPYPVNLSQALMRRCARNLAMRKIPLGIAASEVEATRVGWDIEVKRFEAPYRRRVFS